MRNCRNERRDLAEVVCARTLRPNLVYHPQGFSVQEESPNHRGMLEIHTLHGRFRQAIADGLEGANEFINPQGRILGEITSGSYGFRRWLALLDLPSASQQERIRRLSRLERYRGIIGIQSHQKRSMYRQLDV
jgi:hypothetical protein